MINVSKVTKSRKLSQEFTVVRTTGNFAAGGWVDGVPQNITMRGIVIPSTPAELWELPEADRIKEAIMVYTTDPLLLSRTGQNPGNADKVVWQGKTYNVILSKNYSSYGYVRSVGVLADGS